MACIIGQYNQGAAAGWEREIQTDTNGNLIITPLAGSTFDCNITKIAGTAVTAGAGAVTAGTLRITHASDDPVTTAIQIMDDWDETDRCKVNIIPGQAGISAGAGTVGVTTPRVTLASDDPVTTAVQLIDDTVNTADTSAYVAATSKCLLIGAVRHDAGTSLVSTDQDIAPLQVNAYGMLNVNLDTVRDVPPEIGAGNAGSGTLRVSISTDDVNLSAIKSATELIDDAIYTDATGTPSKGIAIMGTDGTNPQLISCNASGELKITSSATNKPATVNATGSAAIATTTAISDYFKLVSVTVHFSAAPTTAGNLTISKDALAGAAYDVVLNTIDATLGADIVYIPEGDLLFVDGDELAVAYANADGRTYGLEITYQKV